MKDLQTSNFAKCAIGLVLILTLTSAHGLAQRRKHATRTIDLDVYSFSRRRTYAIRCVVLDDFAGELLLRCPALPAQRKRTAKRTAR